MSLYKLTGHKDATPVSPGWTITFIGTKDETMIQWVNEIIEKGGVPYGQNINGEDLI